MRWVAAVMIALISVPAFARADDAPEARLARLRGCRATLEARDHVAGRTFTATIVYRYPDFALATIAETSYVHLRGGRRTLRQEGRVEASDDAAWMRAAADLIAPAGGLGAPGAPDLKRLADRLGIELTFSFRRGSGRVSIALMLGHRYDPASGEAPGLSVQVGGGVEATAGPSGFPERLVLRGPTGRVDAEVAVTSFEAVEKVPDAWLETPALAADLATASARPDGSPELKERVAADTVRGVLGRMRAAGARDTASLGGTYAALLRAIYPVERLRDEARRAVSAERETVLKVLADPRLKERGPEETKAALRDRFEKSCRIQLAHTMKELIHLGEEALAKRADAPAGDEDARRRLLSAAAGAALAAFESGIVAPMVDEAMAEIDRIRTAPPSDAPKSEAPAAGKSGGEAGR